MFPRILSRSRIIWQTCAPKVQPYKGNYQYLKKMTKFDISRAEFSVSASRNGIFDFWKKKEENVSGEGKYNFTDNAPDMSVGSSLNDGTTTSRSFEGQSLDMTSRPFEGRNLGDGAITSGSFEGQSLDDGAMADTGSRLLEGQNLDIGQISDLAEPLTSFADFGLGGGIMPYRLFQDLLEFLTTNLGLEWIPAIAILTVVLRTITLPGVISMRHFSARTHNAYPETLKLMQRVQKFLAQGNKFEVKKARMEYMDHINKNKLNPMRALLINSPNAVVFMSMFYGIRQICTAKVPSLVSGGMLWFSDLTIPDPYFILPVVSCVSMSLIIVSGAADAEMGVLASMDGFRKFFMLIPLISIPFLVFQPAAMFAFWMVSNIFTASLIFLLRNRTVENFFGIPERKKHDAATAAAMKKSMNPIDLMKQAKKNREDAQKLMKKVEDYKVAIKKLQELEKKKKS